MARFAAFLDACTLVPVAPCDTLLRLAESGMFRPLWSRRVEEEALRALEEIHPEIDPSRFQSRFRSMNESFDDALVEGWEGLERSIELPDPDDRHVVAAALCGRADAIITENLQDFPAAALAPLGLEVISVDNFLLDQFDLDPVATHRVLIEQAAAKTNPPADLETLLTQLARGGARQFVSAARARLLEDE